LSVAAKADFMKISFLVGDHSAVSGFSLDFMAGETYTNK
jgi:hypothetical protein